MGKRLLIFFFVLTSFLSFGHDHYPNYAFVKNKGQFHANVNYRVDIPSGNLFIENNTITYFFFDQQKISNNHEGIEPLKPTDLIDCHAFKLNWVNANSNPKINETENFNYYLNYFLGDVKATGIYPAKSLWVENLYPNIHVKWLSDKGSLKYEYFVEPNANPNKIIQNIVGVKASLQKGKLVYKTALGIIEEDAPYAYQVINNQKVEIECKFTLNNNKIGFEVGNYNKNLPLIIDPTLIFSTYSGSTSNNFGYTATFDSEGHLFSGSTIFGANGTYPTTLGAFQNTFKGGVGGGGVAGTDIGISKFAQDGTSLIYSTYIGGFADEMPHSLFVNTRDELYVFGTTGSFNFPTTQNAYDTLFESGTTPINLVNGLGVNYAVSCDLFVTRFSIDGSSLMASTFIGGAENDGINNVDSLKYNYADEVRGEIEIDSEDNVYIATCTKSQDFPMVGNPFQPTKGQGQDGVIIKLNADLSQILWSSFYGGNADDALYSLAITKNNDVYVTGGTNSNDLPAFSNFIFSVFVGGRSDGFVGRIKSTGDTLQESSYCGTDKYDQIYFVETDKDENIYLLGQTESQGLAFVVNLDPDSIDYLNYDAGQFIIKFNSEIDSIWWSTRFGKDDKARPKANPNISPTAFLVDLCNSIYLSGWGGSTNINAGNNISTTVDSMYITAGTAQQTTTDGSDFYLFVLSDDAQQVNYASYFGGNQSSEHVDGGTSRFDRKGKIYQAVCAGCGGNSDFPIFPANAVSANNNSSCNLGVFKMDFLLPLVVADFTVDEKGCAPYSPNFTNTSLTQSSTQFYWDFGDNTTSTDTLPTKIFTTPGVFTIKLSLSDTNSCNLSDTITRVIYIEEDTTQILATKDLCLGDSINSRIISNPNYSYLWLNSSSVSDSLSANTKLFTDSNQTFTLLQNNGVCVDSIFIPIQVDSVLVTASPDTTLCNTAEINLTGSSTSQVQFYIWSTSRNLTDTLNFILDPNHLVTPPNAVNKYYLHVVNTNNCIGLDSTQINISGLALQTQNDTAICFGDSIWVRAFSLNPNDTLSYSWTPSNAILSKNDSSQILVSPATSLNYIVNSTNQAGCPATENITVTVSKLNPDSVLINSSSDTVYLGKSVTISAFPNGYSYNWINPKDISTGFQFDDSPQTTTQYEVEIIDPSNQNCTYKAVKTVYVKEILCDEPELFIPTGFTPNGDLNNDIFSVYGKNILNFEVNLYNRWGEKVITLNNTNPSWDGKIEAEEAPEAVYYFDASIECVDNQKFFKKGDLTLVR